MKNSLFKRIFSSGLQAISVQVLGVLFFLVVSVFISKNDFGVINWANAVSMTLTLVVSFGLDQVVVRRIATSDRSDWAAAAYLFHLFVGFLVVLAIIVLLVLFVNNALLAVLPWFFIAQAITFIGGPFKHYLNAKQNFTPYAVIAVISNTLKLVALFFCIKLGWLSITSVVIILIVFACLEFFALLFYVLRFTALHFKFKLKAYKMLIREALPQYVSVLANSSLARFDWILLGIITTNVKTAEYSFAYRAYELSRLPLVALEPVILASFSRMFFGANKLDSEKQQQIRTLFNVEMFFGLMIPLFLVIVWSPALDFFFQYVQKGDKKYGSVNYIEFSILSACIPFQFFINILWALSFANRRYIEVTRIIVITALANIILNICLIPVFEAKGAAISFLITSILQTIGYYRLVNLKIMAFNSKPFFVFCGLAITAFVFSTLVEPLILKLLIAFTVYFLGALVTKQIGKENLYVLKSYIKR